MVQTRLSVEAFKDAQRSIFMQDNAFSEAFNVMVSVLQKKGQNVAAAGLRVALPIVKVPTNIVAESFEYAGGTVTGSAKLAKAIVKGFDKLTPDQADLIMRHLKKGSIGAAIMLLGYFNADKIGGFYQKGEKRKRGEPGAGSVRINGIDVPETLLHHPAAETLQVGATVKRVADSKVRGHAQGTESGAWAAGLGLVEQVPFAKEATDIARFFDPRERNYAEGQLLQSILVPALVKWMAEQTDRENGEKVKRKTETPSDAVKSAIPVLRQTLPKRDPSKSFRK